MNETPVVCDEMDSYPTFTDAFITCPVPVYTIFTTLDLALTLFQIGVFVHLMWVSQVERRKEVSYLVSLVPICSVISVLELFNPSTTELLSAFRFVYLVFCILQFYQYVSSYYGDWEDLLRLLPGFVFETQIGCWCCKYRKEISVSRRRLYTNKTLVYTGVITYMVMIMISVAFVIPEAAEDALLTIGIILFILGIKAMKRFITITQQFYPELAGPLRRKWVAVRICFLVVGVQGFLLRVLSAIGVIPPMDLFNKRVMIDVTQNLLVPMELSFAMVLAHRAFSEDSPSPMEQTPLLPKQSRGDTSCQTDMQTLLSDTLVRVDSGVDSPEFEYIPGYGSLSAEMMAHVEGALEDGWRRSHPDLYQAGGEPGYRQRIRIEDGLPSRVSESDSVSMTL